MNNEKHILSEDIALHAMRLLIDDFGMKITGLSKILGMSRTFIDKIYQGHSQPTKNFAVNMTYLLVSLEHEIENLKTLSYEYERDKQKDHRESGGYKKSTARKEHSVWG